ncbi:GIY-YIG nuclease family protein [Dysgonomonas sp. OttesenSCG-928-M03]|nr:GIY-YIG nuclease family protein [Dysgonomonas sp. OttesenSCG-928-M03]
MRAIGTHNYFVYILTNFNKTVLYTGVTNCLRNRLFEHRTDAENERKHFTGKYNVIYLVYWERFTNIEDAISREKQIKGWTRIKKENLILEFNSEWKFLNDEIEDF